MNDKLEMARARVKHLLYDLIMSSDVPVRHIQREVRKTQEMDMPVKYLHDDGIAVEAERLANCLVHEN